MQPGRGGNIGSDADQRHREGIAARLGQPLQGRADQGKIRAVSVRSHIQHAHPGFREGGTAVSCCYRAPAAALRPLSRLMECGITLCSGRLRVVTDQALHHPKF